MSEFSYWYHPASESFYFQDKTEDSNMGDGMSVEITLPEYVERCVSKVSALILNGGLSVDESLPENVDAVLKDAELNFNGRYWLLYGAVHHDRHERFKNSHKIYSTQILQVHPGGIYETAQTKYLVQFKDPTNYDINIPTQKVSKHG